MSEKETTTTIEGAIGEIEQGPSKVEQFLDRNQRYLFLLGILLLIAALGFIVLRSIDENRAAQAGAAFLGAEQSTALKEVSTSYEGTPAAGSALLLLAQKQWEGDQKEAALTTLRSLLSDYSDHPATKKGRLLFSKYLVANGDVAGARQSLTTLLEEGDPTYSPAAKLFLAELRASAQPEESQRLYEELASLDESAAGNLISIAEARKRILASSLPPVVEPSKTAEKVQETQEAQTNSEITPALTEGSPEEASSSPSTTASPPTTEE